MLPPSGILCCGLQYLEITYTSRAKQYWAWYTVLWKSVGSSFILYVLLGKWCSDLMKHVQTYIETVYITEKQSWYNSNEFESLHRVLQMAVDRHMCSFLLASVNTDNDLNQKCQIWIHYKTFCVSFLVQFLWNLANLRLFSLFTFPLEWIVDCHLCSETVSNEVSVSTRSTEGPNVSLRISFRYCSSTVHCFLYLLLFLSSVCPLSCLF